MIRKDTKGKNKWKQVNDLKLLWMDRFLNSFEFDSLIALINSFYILKTFAN